jgi:signal transduction histidine kinase
VAKTDKFGDGLEIILAGISHDLRRELDSIADRLETWVGRVSRKVSGLDKTAADRISTSAKQCRRLADTATTLVNEADDGAFRNSIAAFVSALETEVTEKLSGISQELQTISTSDETGGRLGAMLQLAGLGRGIERSAEQLRDLTQFVYLSQEPHYQAIDLRMTADNVKWGLLGLFEREAISESALRIQGKAKIKTDRALVSAILANLISNTVAHRRKGHPLRATVHIGATTRDKVLAQFGKTERVAILRPHQWAEIRVSDNGAGIPQSEGAQIFNLFRQGSDARLEGVGSGVGLALVEFCLRVLGGCVRVESRLGSGSTFIVSLPNGPFRGRIPPIVEPS